MNNFSEYASFIREEIKGIRISTNEPMREHTSFRIGGLADIFAEPSVSELPLLLDFCKNRDIPVTIIGNGSNILVSDKGIRGICISIGRGMKGLSIEENLIKAQAGEILSSVSRAAMENSLKGMEFAFGIPGSLGGAVVMNAGAYGGEMKDVLVNATCVTPQGQIKIYEAKDLSLSYRHSAILETGDIVCSVLLSLETGNQKEIEDRMEELTRQRKEKQPLEYPSAGSFFKRPQGYFAGKLIMDAGLKGAFVGGARVSEKHAGFVINTGGATCQEVMTLMEMVKTKVEKEFGVALEPEVRFVGEF